MPKKKREHKAPKERLIIVYHPACQTKRHREGYKYSTPDAANRIVARRTTATITEATFYDKDGFSKTLHIPGQKTFVMGMGPKKYK